MNLVAFLVTRLDICHYWTLKPKSHIRTNYGSHIHPCYCLKTIGTICWVKKAQALKFTVVCKKFLAPIMQLFFFLSPKTCISNYLKEQRIKLKIYTQWKHELNVDHKSWTLNFRDNLRLYQLYFSLKHAWVICKYYI